MARLNSPYKVCTLQLLGPLSLVATVPTDDTLMRQPLKLNESECNDARFGFMGYGLGILLALSSC